MKARFVAIAFALLISMCSSVRSEPSAVYKAEDMHTQVLLFEGVPCTNKDALSITLPTEAYKYQAGRVMLDGHSFEMCWQRDGDDVWIALVTQKGEAVPAHSYWHDFKKDEGV